MKYRIYTPQSAFIPSTAPIQRKPLGARKHIFGRRAPEPAEFVQFETHALVHDIFLVHDANQVVAIGPPLLNLSSKLTPVHLTVEGGGKPIKARIANRSRFYTYTFDLPDVLHSCNKLSIQLSFADQYHFKFDLQRQLCDSVNLQLATIQKDNPVIWILDWIQYYEHLGVERILLYDNGSTNLLEIEQALENLTSTIDLILIVWPYKFGPRASTRNRFCQWSRTSHAFGCFGQAIWTANFDLDEYLIFQQNSTDVHASTDRAVESGVLTSLTQNADPRVGQLRFDSHWVPNVASTFDGHSRDTDLDPDRDQAIDNVHTVRNFPYREKLPRGTGQKYLVRQQALHYAKTHNCRLKFGYRRVHVPVSEAAFLHYKPLTTEWKAISTSAGKDTLRGRPETLDEMVHVAEGRVIATMKVVDNQ